MYLGFIHPAQTEALTIQLVRELTQNEVEDYKRAIATIAQHTSHKFAPRMVYENDADFFSAMQNCLQHYFSDKPKPQHLQEYTFIANKVLLNSLSSVRFFEDFVKTQLARKYGSGSPQVESFGAALSRSSDSSFAYRFMYKFRNYVQHCGTAVEHMEISVRPNEVENASLTITCKAEKLLEKYKEWGKVTADLRLMETINLAKMVTDLTTEIEQLDVLARSLLVPELETAASRIRQIIGDALDKEGMPVLYEVHASDGVLKQVPIKHPPLELLSQLGLL